MELLTGLQTRRSVAPKDMAETAPTEAQLAQMLAIATRVPDHGKLAPWRLRLFDKVAQGTFGAMIAARYQFLNPEANEAHIAFERARPTRAPYLVAVLSTPVQGKIPVWEQQLSAGAVCLNLLHGCNALGFGAKWLTEWIAYDAEILKALGGDPAKGDAVAGFIYIGGIKEIPTDRERPDLVTVATPWQASGQ
jgi:nitroreductase